MIDTTGRHASVMQIARWFDFDHLPERLGYISSLIEIAAENMIEELHDGPELTAGLRKLLEAKDCFVRQAVLDQEKVKVEEPNDKGTDEGQPG